MWKLKNWMYKRTFLVEAVGFGILGYFTFGELSNLVQDILNIGPTIDFESVLIKCLRRHLPEYTDLEILEEVWNTGIRW